MAMLPYSKRFSEALHNVEGLTDMYIVGKTDRTLIEKPFDINLQRLVKNVVERMKVKKLALTQLRGLGETRQEVVSSRVRGTIYCVLLNEWHRCYQRDPEGEAS